MWNFRGGLGFDLVDLGGFQAPRLGDDSHSTRFDIHSTRIFLMAVNFDIISTRIRQHLDEFEVLIFFT